MTEFHLGGAIEEATFLIDLAHVKGHPSCSYAGAIKNLGLRCVAGKTRAESRISEFKCRLCRTACNFSCASAEIAVGGLVLIGSDDLNPLS